MITVDRETWNRWNGTGEWVLFRAAHNRLGPDGKFDWLAPHEFVEAAQPCELCDPRAWVPRKPDLPCGDCLDGKRRIAVAVSCDEPGCPHVGPCNRGRDGRGYLTVGQVVVEWGPLVVEAVQMRRSGLWIASATDWHQIGRPPDIDPQTLVGKYAIGGKVVTP